MSIEAMKLAIEAWDACGRYPDATSDIERLDVAINALRAALSQQPATTEPVAQWQKRHPVRTAGRWQSTDEHDAKWWRERATGWEVRALYTRPAPSAAATGEPVARSEREQLRHAQAAVVMPMIGPLLDAWENSDREVMSQEPELSKQLKNINSAMEDADTHPSPSVPDDVVRVPVQVLKDASEALGNFVSDHGWGDADMQAMDNLDAYIARHEAIDAAMLAAKKAPA